MVLIFFCNFAKILPGNGAKSICDWKQKAIENVMKMIRKKVIIGLWGAVVALMVTCFTLLVMIFKGWIGYMPDLYQLNNPVNKFASQVLTSDGKLMGTWSYSNANRVFVSFDQLPQHLVNALVATEDERFYGHCGIDFRALGRAVIKRGLMGQKSAGGGSTLTQQLAKQLYSERAENTTERLLQKPIEWIIALKLERFYTKDEIITLYLNYFDFLYNAVGIKTAAKTYFNKDPKELTVTESALLVGMCKNPSYYNPVRHPERCTERRNVVLGQMKKCGYITDSEFQNYKAEPLAIKFTRIDHKVGMAPYLREHLRKILMANRPNRLDYASWQYEKYYEDSLAWETDSVYGWCNKHKKRDGSHYNVYTDGLKIYCTIDSRMQQYAEEAVQEHVLGHLQPIFDKENQKNPRAPYNVSNSTEQYEKLLARAMRQSGRWNTMKRAGYSEEEIRKAFDVPVEMTIYTPTGDMETTMTPRDSILYYKKFLRSAFMCMDNRTGEVKAYVGGTNFRHFGYDMATHGKRQVGSTIKPFLYTLAMESGKTPCDLVSNERASYGGWSPRGGGGGGYLTLKQALASSNNTCSAHLISELTPVQFVQMLRQFGVKQKYIGANMTLCLGSLEISLEEMISAYSAFPNKGVRKKPLYVTRIEDSEGNVVADLSSGIPPQSYEVMSAPSSYRMITLLKGVINGGTGIRMRARYGIQSPMGGKTGTTNGNSDGWFMGFTPSLTFGAWVGGEERSIHFNSTSIGQGASAALPICALFLKKVFHDGRLGYNPNQEFDIPSDHHDCEGMYDEGMSDVTGVDEFVEF